MIRLDAETLYHKLLGVIEEQGGRLDDEADSALADIATSVASAANEEAERADSPRYGCFTAAANYEVAGLVEALRDPDFLPRQQWGDYLRNGLRTIETHHPGAGSGDTAVRELIVATLDRITEEQGVPTWGSYLNEDYLS